MATPKHLCGKCGRKFDTEGAYLKHVCRETGFSPREPKHFNLNNKVIAEKALPKEKIVYLSEKTILAAVKKARQKKDNA